MKRSILQLTALALILTTTGIANAKGGNSGSKGSGSKNYSVSSYKMSSSSYCKPYGKCYYNSSFSCSHRCYCNCFGCYSYWYDNCWCLWYQPWGCYIPWSTYCTLVTPAIGQTAAAKTLTPPAPPAQ